MAVQFYMRAYNTVTKLYVDWVVNDTPDNTGVYAPGGNAHLTNITVNRTVQSKINNFLKPVIEPSYITNVSYNNPQDGYLFHLNSYDWLNPVVTTGPISIPALNQPIGISIVRGSASTGEPFTPSNYASLYWEEGLGEWSFAYINSDGSIGTALPVSTGTLQIDGYLSVTDSTSDPVALSGLIRLPDNQFIKARNSANSGDAILIGLDNSVSNPPTNRVNIGGVNYSVYVSGHFLLVDNSIVQNDPVLGNSLAATSGFISAQNNTAIIAARNAANNANLTLLSTTAGNLITLGDTVNSGIVYNTSTGNVHNFEVNSVSEMQITGTQITVSVPTVTFASAVSFPVISQTTTGGAGGQALTVQAQNAATTGGNLNLTSGTGATAGNINLETGGVIREIVTPTGMIQTTATYAFGGTADTGGNVTAPTIKQDNLNVASGTGQPLTVQAQNSIGTSGVGGNLVLTSGSGSSTTNAGQVWIEVGSQTPAAIVVSPGTPFPTVTMAANLTVLGTTTTIDSTTIDIEGRVIHANWTASNVTFGTPPAPNLANSMNGLTIHRGNPSGGGPSTNRDSAGLIYNETTPNTGLYVDGYWKLVAVQNDIDTSASTTGLTATLPMLAAAVVATPNPVQEYGSAKAGIPSAGGFRTLNSTIAVSSRNAAATQDLRLIGTDSANHIILGETPTPQNAGFQLYTTTGGFTDFFVNNVSQIQIASDGNGPFVRESLTLTPALSAFIRVPNNTLAVAARNAAGTQDLVMLSSDATNHIVMGNTASPQNAGFIFNTTAASVFDYQTASVSKVQLGSDTNGPFVRESATTFVPAVSGFVRVPNATTAVAARNAGNTTDILLVGTDSLNHILFGDSSSPTNAGMVFSTTTNSVFDFWVNGQSQVQILQDNIVFTNTDGYASISQAPTYSSSVTGAPLTVAAQSVFGSNGIGGNLVLSSGFGGLIDGYVDLQVSGITVAAVEPNKFTFIQGRRRHITQVTGTYNVALTDDFIAITTLIAPFSIFLPAFPALGDAYEIKDTTGNAGVSNVTINGNGANIDGTSIFTFTQPYAAATFTFTGITWSVT